MDEGASTEVTSVIPQELREGGSDLKNHRHTSVTVQSSERACYNPVDTGWSWVILLSLFVIQFVSVGLLRAFGVLFVAIQSTFQTSASMIAVIGGLESAVFSVTAVFCLSGLLEVTSVRRATLIGAFIGTCGLVASFLVSSVTALFFSFSICLGIGMGMSMLPGYILLNTYFERKLPLATAMANTGSSIGIIIMPMVTQMLLDTYFLSGSLLLLGGVFAQILVVGSLFTPPSDYNRRKGPPQNRRPSKEETEIKWKQLHRLLTEENTKVPGSRETVSDIGVNEEKVKPKSDISNMELLTKSLPSINGQQIRRQCSQLTATRWRDSWRDRLCLEAIVMAAGMSHAASLGTLKTSTSQKDSAFRTGFRNEQVRSSEHTPENKDYSKGCGVENSSDMSKLCSLEICGICDGSLCRSTVFWVWFSCQFCASLVCTLPSAYLPALAQDKGLTLTQGALLLTICGSLDIVSRLVPGILAQANLVKPQTSVAVSVLVLGIIFQFTAVMDGMAAMVMMSVVYGLFSGVFYSMIQLIILDFSDLSKFRQMYSITQLALGASGVSGYLIVGYLRDFSGSYVTSFHFMGACGLLASTLLFVMPALQRRQAARDRSYAAASDAGDTI